MSIRSIYVVSPQQTAILVSAFSIAAILVGNWTHAAAADQPTSTLSVVKQVPAEAPDELV